MGLFNDPLEDESMCASISARIDSTVEDFWSLLSDLDSFGSDDWEGKANEFIKNRLEIDSLLQILMEHDKLSKFAFAQVGARKRLETDPTQLAKIQVRECWEDWQKHPNRYKSKARFARDMQDKWPQELSNVEVITRWCRAWEKERAIEQAK